MSENGTTELPASWVWTTLGEVCERPEYGWTTRANFSAGQLRFLRTTDISGGTIEWSTVPFCEDNPPDPDRYRLRPGDIVISRAGSVGLSALIGDGPSAVFASYLIRFRPSPLLDTRFVLYFLKSPMYWSAIAEHSAGIALQNVNARKLAAIPMPLAPLPEQHRIVEEIETQLTRLDAAVAALERTRAHLKRYRAAVLAAACSGRLAPTEAELARAEGRDFEPADHLLARLTGTASGRNGSRAEHGIDASRLPELPEGWTWATWDQLSSRVTVGHVGPMKHEYVQDGVPFLRSQNVRENRFDPNGLLYISPAFHSKLSKSVLRPGDLAVVRSGSVGVTCVIPESLGEANCADLVLIQRPVGIDSRYGSFYMNSAAQNLVRAGQVGSALIHFNTKSVASLPVALPPLAEQHRIVAEVERRLSVVDELEATVAANLKRAERMRQAILRKAFAGQLVPQDPNDEPASALVERIRAEREAAAPHGQRVGSKHLGKESKDQA